MRLYISILSAVFLICSAYFLLAEYVLNKAGEVEGVRQPLDEQEENDGLYFTLAESPGNYKLASYARRKPDILFLGSSRAHTQHQEFYTRSFFNMGGLVYTPGDALLILDQALPIHKPKIVIYNLDFFGFCTVYEDRANATDVKRPVGKPQTGWAWTELNRFMFLPYLLNKGIISYPEIKDIALGRQSDVWEGVKLYGFKAIRNHLGFRIDGALTPVDDVRPDPVNFKQSLEEIVDGTGHFGSKCLYDRTAMARLDMLEQELKSRGIELVLIETPLPPTAYKMFMSAPESIVGFYRQWRKDLVSHHFRELHLMLDGATIGGRDDEFRDSVHGGDVIQARELLAASEDPGSILKNYINRPILERIIREKTGISGLGLKYYRSLKDAP